MTDIPVKRGTTGAEGEEKKLKGEWGMKDAEPLAGEAIGHCPFPSPLSTKQAARQGCCREKATVFGWGEQREVCGRWQAAGDPEKQARGGEGAGTTSEAASSLTSPGRHGPFPTP